MREIKYTVSLDGVSPSNVQFGGMQGEHNATRLNVEISGDLLAKLEGAGYRFEAEDGAGCRQTIAMGESVNKSIICKIPQSVTCNGGNVTIRLIFSKVDATEIEYILYSFPMKLRFDLTSNGEFTENKEASELSAAVSLAKDYAEQAKKFVGKDGISATHFWNGTVLTVTSGSGTTSADLKGEKGESGVFVGVGDMPDGYDIQIDPSGETLSVVDEITSSTSDELPNCKAVKNHIASVLAELDGNNGTNGKDGISATHSWNGTVLTVTSASGTSSADLKGEKGDKGEQGIQGEKGDPYTLTDADKAEIAEQAVTIIDGIPDYWRAHLDGRVEDIRRAMEAAGRNKSAFLFYTDAHWTENHKQSPKLLKYLYNNTPINKVNYGGDIVQAEPTNDNVDDAIEMSYIYEWRKAIRCLPNHHSVVGNHDDGSAINNRFADEYIYSYLLAPEENNDVVMGDGFYYYIDDKAERTRYLYLDTAYKMADTQQIEFVVNALNTTPADWHIVAISHIWHDALWNETQGDYIGDYSEAASKFLQLFYAYNHRTNGETSGIAYGFSQCGGKVEFCIGGHAHWDYTSYYNDEILVILTETDSTRERVNIDAVGGTITENSVNAIVANYNDNTVAVIRIGRGESRVEEIRSALPAAYTNVLFTAVDKDGSIFNACGYKTDTRYSNSGGGFVTANGVTCTGLIKIAPNTEKVIRFKNIRMNINDTASNVCHMLTFNGTLDNLAYFTTMNGASMVENYSAVTDEEGNITQITMPANEPTTYMVFNTGGIGADSIITINEPIE